MCYFISPVVFLRWILWRVYIELFEAKSQFQASSNTGVTGNSNLSLGLLGNSVGIYVRAAWSKFMDQRVLYLPIKEGQWELKQLLESLQLGKGKLYKQERMDTAHPLAVVGRELKRKEKGEVTIAFSWFPTVQPHPPMKEFLLHATLSPLSLEAHWITVCSPVYPLVHQKCIALCIDLERKKKLLF